MCRFCTDGRRITWRPTPTSAAFGRVCSGGTCKKCKVQVLQGEVPVSAVDPRAFGTDELRAGWRLACRAPAREDLVVHVPPLQTRPKAALVGVGRHVILRPAVQKRYVELEEPTLETIARTSSACSTRSTTSSRTCPSRWCARSAVCCAAPASR